MSLNDFQIPRMQLPQLGSEHRESDPVDSGQVRSPDTHHDRFVQFLATGDGLDDLAGGIERDTIGEDGRTASQREVQAETTRQERIVAGTAAPTPSAPRRKASSFFDEDEPMLESCTTNVIPTMPAATDFNGLARDDAAPEPPLSDERTGGDTDGAAPEPPDTGTGSQHQSPAAADPPSDWVASEPAATIDAPVPPPGSLWDATHNTDDPYEPGPMIVDPPAIRPEPGPIVRWLRARYRQWWVPLGAVQKSVAATAAVVLVAWVGYLMITPGHDEPAGPSIADVAPIVDIPASPTATAQVLAPVRADAPGCAARSRPAANAFSSDKSKAWVCVRTFGSDLQTIHIFYDEPIVVTSICIVPGFEFTDSNGRDMWNEHRVVVRMLWYVGGKQFVQEIDPNAHSGACIDIPNVAAQEITGKVFATAPPPETGDHNGPNDDDVNSTFAVSSIEVKGYPAGGQGR